TQATHKTSTNRQPELLMSDPFATDSPVLVVDDIIARPGRQQAVLQLLTGAYAEHARTRGLVLKQTIALPPFEQPGTPSQLILIWEYPSLNALWQARAAESGTALAELWQQIDAMSLRRTRRLGRPEPMAGCERAPEEPAPIDEADNAQRW